MQLRHIFALATVAITLSVGIANADNLVRAPIPNAATTISHQVPSPLLLAPVIQEAKYNCGSTSTSSVVATLINKNGVEQTYTPTFKGQKLDQCVEYYPADCSGLPAGSICLPTKCKTTKAGEMITVKGSAVVVPANGQKQAVITVPNTDFQSAAISVGTVKANLSPLPQTCIF